MICTRITWRSGDWLVMLHYQVFVDYDRQVSDRAIDGFAQVNSVNWFMGNGVASPRGWVALTLGR